MLSTTKQKKLTDLVSIGKAMEKEFHLLGITTIGQLKKQRAESLYKKICAKKGKVDICCQDAYAAAIAQAKNPKLPKEQKNWWYWSRKRLAKETI